MPEKEELMDAITQALDNIEDTLNKEGGAAPDDFEADIAVIDQKWAMLRHLLVKGE